MGRKFAVYVWHQNINIRASTDDKQKISLTAKLMIHIACMKCSYSRLKGIPQDPNTVIPTVFSLSQNKPLPKTSAEKASYWRHAWFYSFGVSVHEVKSHKKKNVHFQISTKQSGWMGVNEIISCLLSFHGELSSDTAKKVGLFAPGVFRETKTTYSRYSSHSYAKCIVLRHPTRSQYLSSYTCQ
jgi:hypothetical protein